MADKASSRDALLSARLGHGVVAFALVVGILLSALVVYDLHRQYVIGIEQAGSETRRLAQLLEEDARQSLRRVERSMALAAGEVMRAGDLSGTDLAALRERLRAHLPQDGLIRGFAIFGRDGAHVVSTGGEIARAVPSVADRDYIVAQRERADLGLAVSAAIKSRVDGKWIMLASRQLEAPGGAFQGVLLGAVETAYFQRMFDSINAGANGFVALFLHSGPIVVRAPFNAEALSRNWADSPMFRVHLPESKAKTVREVVALDGVERIYSYRALEDYPVIVSLGLSVSDVLAPWRESARRSGAILLLAIAALNAAALMLLRQLRRHDADIIERKRAEEASRASEVLKASVLSTALDGIVVIDQHGSIAEFNPAAERIFGYRRDEVLGRPMSGAIIPERLREQHAASMRRYLASGEGRILGKHMELPAIRADGSEFPVELMVTRIPGTAFPMFTGFVRDITGRKRTEQLLALEHAVARHFAEIADLSEAMSRAIRAICESERWECGRYLWVDDNAGVLRFGADWSVPNAVVERYLEELRGKVHPAGFGVAGKAWQSQKSQWVADSASDSRIAHPALARTAGMGAKLVIPVAAQGKTIGVLIFHSRQVREPDEQPLQALRVMGGQIGQFLQRAQISEGLRQSEDRYRLLFDKGPVPIYVFDRETLRILAANERMAQQYGWSREELLGMSLLELRPPAERAKAQAAARGTINPYEKRLWRHWRRDGEIFEVELTSYDLDYEGRPARLVSPIDVSVRERTERALHESAENLRSLSRRLVSVQEDQRRTLARELHDRAGQNLTALAINLEVLRGGTGRMTPGELGRRISESLALVDSTAKMIEDVTADLHPPMLYEYGLAAALRWYGGQQAARAGLRVDVRAEGDGPAPSAERDLALFRITQEAMTNVLKHAHASRVEIALTEDAQGLELSLRDDGRGMDAESEVRSPMRHGTRIMRERAMAIGATFELAPSPGGGTIVRVRVAP